MIVTTRGSDEDLQEVLQYNRMVFDRCLENERSVILADERELAYRLDTLDTFRLAENAARVVPQLVRIAIVTNLPTMEDAFPYETVAVNRGLTAKVF